MRAIREDNQITDSENIIGADSRADSTFNEFDLIEPPLISGRSVSVFFSSEKGELTHDIRPLNAEGYFWNMTVRSPDHGRYVNLSFDQLDQLPEKAYLVDFDTKMVTTLIQNKVVRINTITGTRIFRLIVGNKEYAQKNSGGVDLFPKDIKLYPNYPNPFNPTTTLRYTVPENAEGAAVRLRIYDLLGKTIATLIDQPQSAGYYEIVFDARNLASGIYFARLEVERTALVQKLVLMK
jgi:hypothetical protein